jgi:Transposase
MYVCILDQSGEILLHRNMQTSPDALLNVIAPYRDHIVVAAECMCTWYWRTDLCAAEGIPFVLGHARYMKAIHGGKAKHDTIDAQKIAVLLRGGRLPQAYVYPAAMRAPAICSGVACIWRTNGVNFWRTCRIPTARITCRPSVKTSPTRPIVTASPNVLPIQQCKGVSQSTSRSSTTTIICFAT